MGSITGSDAPHAADARVADPPRARRGPEGFGGARHKQTCAII